MFCCNMRQVSHVTIVTHSGEQGRLAATSLSHRSVVSACAHLHPCPFILPPHTPPALCSAITCSVKPDGVPQLCRTDEIGELCVCAIATGTSYYGLSGMTKNTFEVGGEASTRRDGSWCRGGDGRAFSCRCYGFQEV